MRLLLTGGTGFIGNALMHRIVSDKHYALTVSVRSKLVSFSGSVRIAHVADLSARTDWSDALFGTDTVIHLAGRAHVLSETASDPSAEFRRINVGGTLNLARQAVDHGVRRFVFISSIGVNGALTLNDPFTEQSKVAPVAHYAVSKYEAEQALWLLCENTNMELVVIRPPLVYAGHAPGNFARLLKLVASGIPLPFASVVNQRSMVALENLTDFILLCAKHPSAANQTFLVSDGEDLSTPTMLRYLAEGMNKPSRLMPIPVTLMHLGAKILHQEPVFNQLCGSLVVDSSKARRLLKWVPLVTAEQAMRKAAQDYLKSKHPSNTR